MHSNKLVRPYADRRAIDRRGGGQRRNLNICEERGGGLGNGMLEIERLRLPAPEFISSAKSMRVGAKLWRLGYLRAQHS